MSKERTFTIFLQAKQPNLTNTWKRSTRSYMKERSIQSERIIKVEMLSIMLAVRWIYWWHRNFTLILNLMSMLKITLDRELLDFLSKTLRFKIFEEFLAKPLSWTTFIETEQRPTSTSSKNGQNDYLKQTKTSKTRTQSTKQLLSSTQFPI